MKKILYSLYVVLSLSMLTSCFIDDDSLDDDIRRKFEQERNGSIERPGRYDANCTVSIGESAFLKSNCAVKVNLAGKSTGYRYYFSKTPLSEQEVRSEMLAQKLIPGKDYNYAVKDYNLLYLSTTDFYLYVVGYDGNGNYGPIAEAEYTVKAEWSYSNPTVDIDGIEKDRNELSWNFKPNLNYSKIIDIDYYVLTDDEADFASKLSAAELAVYIHSFPKYSITLDDYVKKPMKLKLDTDPKSVMVVSKIASPLIINRLYKAF